MKTIYYILLLTIITSSCNHKKMELSGEWRIDFEPQSQSDFNPYGLIFKKDSLLILDYFNFTHRTTYSIEKDSILIKFPDQTKIRIEFSKNSDSIISFDNAKFLRMKTNYFSNIFSYELIDFKTKRTLKDNPIIDIIHLVNINGTSRVLLNDQIKEFKYIPEFLIGNKSRTVELYIGKDVSFLDLIEVYKWLYISHVDNVTLVLANNGYRDFYSQHDTIGIDQKILEEFITQNNIPPFPPKMVNKNEIDRKIISIQVNNDILKLDSLSESIDYLIRIDLNLDIIDYFRINEIINSKSNIKKEINGLQHHL